MLEAENKSHSKSSFHSFNDSIIHAFVLHGRPGVMTTPLLAMKPATASQPSVWGCFLVLQLLGWLWVPCFSHCHTSFLQKTKEGDTAIMAVGCPLALLQRTVGTTSLPPYLCFFHILKYRRSPLDMRKHFFTVRMLGPQLTAVLWQTSEQMPFFQAFLTETCIGNDACSNVV